MQATLKADRPLTAGVLQLDAAATTEAIAAKTAELIHRVLRKKGAVVGLSGGIDSTVTAALCARALGPDRVLGVLMPERDSSADTLMLSALAAEAIGIETVNEDMTAILEANGCYSRRDEAIKQVIPEYGPGWVSKIVLPNVIEAGTYRIYSVVARSPQGQEVTARLTPKAMLQVVAATNFKQRCRKTMEYYHADRLNYAVAGTPNRLEFDQGFFVKNGDGSADVKPIAHLYKTQVYQLAAHLGLPDEIRVRPPTTDTYSMEQSQAEFYFSLPYEQMDMCLYGRNNGLSEEEVGAAIGISAEQVGFVYRDIDSKRRASRYLHAEPLLVEEVALPHD